MLVKIRILALAFAVLFVSLIIRLFYWQIIRGKDLSQDAKNQYSSSVVTRAPRGNILASDGTYWVLRDNAWLIYANTKLLTEEPKKVANMLAAFFVSDSEDKNAVLDEANKLTGLLSKNGAYIPLEKKVPDSIKKNIQALDIKGINFESEEDRFYPEASSAAQLLGFVGKNAQGDDVGYFGLEGYYNLSLSGKAGFVGGERDAKGNPILLGGSTEVSAIPGVDLVTSIDKRVQILAETKLKEGIEKYGAKGGNVTIIDPFSGNVLAMAAYPSFDPASYQDYGDALFKNPVISNTFEPGSILKPVVMAAGLDAGVVTPDTKCDICSGPLNVDQYSIKTWNNEYHPDISMTDVIVDSDNVGMSFVGQKLGKDQMYDYLTKFGVGQLTGIDLQGEVAPALRKKGTWSNVDLATSSFGQGVAVTGIEMIRAISAIANGGYLVTPKVVQSLQGDGWNEPTNSTPKKRIISQKAASEASEMMVEAATRGEAKWTNIPGFRIAGKTGTAQIPVAGHYDATNTNHSFVGFAPADNPKFVMLVTLDSPTSSPWAAETAAPLWFSIAKDLFPYLGVAPSP